MRHVSLLVIVATASIGLCADEKSSAPDSKALNGAWVLTSGIRGGENLPDEIVKSIHLYVANGKYSVKAGDVLDRGTCKVDPTKTPKTLTLEGTEGPNKGKTMLGIYELDKDTLKVCYDLSGKAFPERFESKPKTPSFLATYERLKSKKHPILLGPNTKAKE